MKLRIQAQYLQPGDIVGSGEVVNKVIINSTQFRPDKVMVELYKGPNGAVVGRQVLWDKYTMINVKREEAKV